MDEELTPFVGGRGPFGPYGNRMLGDDQLKVLHGIVSDPRSYRRVMPDGRGRRRLAVSCSDSRLNRHGARMSGAHLPCGVIEFASSLARRQLTPPMKIESRTHGVNCEVLKLVNLPLAALVNVGPTLGILGRMNLLKPTGEDFTWIGERLGNAPSPDRKRRGEEILVGDHHPAIIVIEPNGYGFNAHSEALGKTGAGVIAFSPWMAQLVAEEIDENYAGPLLSFILLYTVGALWRLVTPGVKVFDARTLELPR